MKSHVLRVCLLLINIANLYEGDPNADGAVHVVSPCALRN